MKKILKTKIGLLAITILVITSCIKNLNELAEQEANSKVQKVGKALMEISFSMKTTKDFEVPSANLSDLDQSTLNPSSEKQKVKMQLFENGQLNITIEEMDFKEKIKIAHKTLLDDSPRIVKTEIIGNTVNFYDGKEKLMNTTKIDIPNHLETVKKIKELGSKFSEADIDSTIATMQGYQFVDNLEKFVRDAPANGIQVLEQGNNYVTLRMPLKNDDSRIKEEAVLLIDKRMNKLVGSRMYGANNELLQSTLFGYNKGKIQSLSAIKVEQKMRLPSGKEVNMVINTKIEDLKFSLNN